MSRQKYENVVIDLEGDAVDGADIYVYDAGTVNLSILYNKDGSGLSNPVSSGLNGDFLFYAENGIYDIKIEATGLTTQWIYDVQVFDYTTAELISRKNAANGYCGLNSDGKVAIAQLTTYSIMPVGAILPYAGNSIPTGWYECDGSLKNRITDVVLFGVVGETYGAGDGVTTFAVPDLRGRTIIGDGQGVGLTNRTRGDKSGEETHILTIAEIPAHTHTYKETASSQFIATAWPSSWNAARTTKNTGSTGGGESHNNMQPYGVAKYIIKY